LDLVEKIKIGVIGCGVAATRDVLPNLIQPDMARRGIELVAVCDNLESRAKETMRTFGAKEAYVDYREMLAKSDINAVAIFTPINLHYPIAMASVQAGKHVYVQKTMTTTLEEANNLLSIVGKKGVKLVASPGQMHNPSLRMSKQMLDGGLIGKPLWGNIIATNDGHIHERTDPSWYYMPGGGPLYSILVYWVTTFCWLLGSVQKVTALSGIAIPTRWWRGKRIDNKMDDSTMIIMDFGDSTFVSAISNFCAKGVLAGSSIHGTKGIIKIPLEAYRSTQQQYRQVFLYNTLRKMRGAYSYHRTMALSSRRKEWTEWAPPLFMAPLALASPWGAHIIADILEFVDCIIKDKEPTIATGQRARHVIEVFEKAYLSAKTGKTQQLETAFA
jgi:predicted dehydrogenase